MSSAPETKAAPQRRRMLHAGSVAMIVGGLIMVVGSLLPWVMTPIGNLRGSDGGGLMTFGLGFIAVAGAVLPYRRLAIAHCFVAGAGSAAIVAWQLARLVQLSATTDAWGQLLPGMGLVMVGGGAVILLRAGFRLVATT
jgi:hypothetical protein